MAEGGAPDCLLLVPFQLLLSSFLKVEGQHPPHSFDRDHSSLFAELSGWDFMHTSAVVPHVQARDTAGMFSAAP